jgi:hypothetical protein
MTGIVPDQGDQRRGAPATPLPARKPSAGALLLGCVPFAAMCVSVPLWDRVHPMVLGMPFNFFWLTVWIALTSLCMSAAYRLEARRERPRESREDGAE